MRSIAAFGVGLVGITACASFGSSGGDAGTTSPEAGTPDSGLPPGSHFCTGSTAIFCADFDGDPDAGLASGDDGNGMSQIDAGVDAGRDLVAFIPAAGPVGEDVAFQTVMISGVADLHVEADVFFETVQNFSTSSASVNIIQLQFGEDGPSAYAQVADSPLQESVYAMDNSANGFAVGVDSVNVVPQDRWVHLVFEAGLITQPNRSKDGFAHVTWNRGAELDAKHPITNDVALTRSDPPSTPVTILSFGAARYEDNTISEPFTVHLDNVVVTALP